MQYAQTVYYTCLNNHCPKHRNVFMEGDSQHADCARERLWLEGQRPSRSRWVWAALSLAAVVAAIAGTVYRMRAAQDRTDVTAPRAQTERSWNDAMGQLHQSEGAAT